MTAIGTVAVSVSPFESRCVASWLEMAPPPLLGTARLNTPTLSNGSRLDLIERLTAASARKRSTGPFARVELRLDRDDAKWFANKVAGGMLGGGWRSSLPPLMQAFCLRCAHALRKRAGRKELHGDQLETALGRPALDERHRKRLRKRLRHERSFQAEDPSEAPGLANALFSRSQIT